MAKAEPKCWLVRDEMRWFRILWRVRKPRKPKRGWKDNRDGRRIVVLYPCAGCVRALMPKSYHLEPGGGPVELPR